MKVHWLLNVFFSVLVLFAVLSFSGCKEQQEYIPYVPVDFSVDLNRFNSLTSTGYSMLYPYDGYGGVIIYCEYYDITTPANSIYHAFDATCTFEVSDSCSIVNEGNGINAVCPCCGSTYTLFDGFPINGDAQYPLKEYNISILGNKLFIKN